MQVCSIRLSVTLSGVRSLCIVATVLFLGACSEPVTSPEFDTEATLEFTQTGVAGCATRPDIIVTDETMLLDAIANASPGMVIAIKGFFAVSADIEIPTDGITITCARPGAGLYAATADVTAILRPQADKITIERLILDASAAASGPIRATNNGESSFATRTHVTNNRVICGPGTCTFFIGVRAGRIEHNHFLALDAPTTGIHVQGSGPLDEQGNRPRPIDGTRIHHNTIVSRDGSLFFGAVRARDGSGVVVAHNKVVGPWKNSFALTNLRASRVESNRLTGAEINGILVLDLSAVVFRANEIAGAQAGGFHVDGGSCHNRFDGNDVEGNGGNVGAIFEIETGGNRWVSRFGSTAQVLDFGDFDCDGDGEPDPNIITGAVRHFHGHPGFPGGGRSHGV